MLLRSISPVPVFLAFAAVTGIFLGKGAEEAALSAPTVDVASVNADGNVPRHLCLTLPAGPSARYACGDLVVGHALPAIQTLGKGRAPTLIYNARFARPMPLVAANVTVGSAVPDSVTAVLEVQSKTGAKVVSGAWMGNSWSANSTRRIALRFGAVSTSSWPTDVYPYTLTVKTHYEGSAYSTSKTGDLAIVNRSTSEFGAGWWIAGLEQLVGPSTSASRIVWVGGDGSVRKYQKVTTNVWAAAAIDRPDTLTWNGSAYIRHLPQGLKVYFSSGGRHDSTVNRLGHTTTFSYNGGLLYRLTVPTASTLAPYFQFNYDGSNQLNSVSSPGDGTRHVTTVWVSSARIDSIQDPDGGRVRFEYPTGNQQVIRRTDRTGVVTRYTHAHARLTSVVVDEGGLAITTTYTPAETRSISTGSRVTALAPTSAYALLNGPRTDVTDHTKFHVDLRYGAPEKIVDALGNTTTVSRSNASYPAAVTTVTHPNGFQQEATYNARGKVLTVTAVNPYGDGRNAVTTYDWGDTGILQDFPTKITSPEGDYDTLSYNLNGTIQWQRDRRGWQTSYRYYSSNLVKAVQRPDGGVDSLSYDSYGNLFQAWTPLGFATTHYRNSIGQDTAVVSPIEGSNVLRTRFIYDEMGRPTNEIRLGPEVTYSCLAGSHCKNSFGKPVPAETLEIIYDYDQEGRVTTVFRTIDPDSAGVGDQSTYYQYDAAGRKTSERNNFVETQYEYDPAGNAVALIRASGDTIRSEHDALNRVVQRVVPEVFHVEYECPTELLQTVPCFAGSVYDSLRILPDTETFSYDNRGNLTAAHNREARVKRTYFRGGALQTDTLRLRIYDGPYLPSGLGSGDGGCTDPDGCMPKMESVEPDPGHRPDHSYRMGIATTGPANDPYPDSEFGSHTYGIAYTYDLNGRRKTAEHPDQLTPSSTKTAVYRYFNWGALQDITGIMGDTYSFTYDSNGRVESKTFPGNVAETYEYDLDGRRTARRLTRSGTLIHDTLTYDARGKRKLVTTYPEGHQTLQAYSGLGALVATDWEAGNSGAFRVDEYRSDPHGNHYWSYQWDHLQGEAPQYDFQYNFLGQLEERKMLEPKPGTNIFRSYDSDGNVSMGSEVIFHNDGGGIIAEYGRRPVRYYYAADGKVRAIKRYARENPNSDGYYQDFDDLISEIRYDALGRRVVQHTRHYPECSSDCYHAIERYVWDGNQLLYELRADGKDGANLDTEWGSGSRYGRVGYLHGPGIDAPLGVMRMNHSLGSYLVVPHADVRGQYERGTKIDGSDCGSSTCGYIDWPASKARTYLDGIARPIYDWMGSLIQDQRDQSGLLYRRNRYYDPNSHRFTQMDPIGIAGGLNLYGFANGDPVSYSDPFGLCPEDITGRPCVNPLGGAALELRPGLGGFGDNPRREAGTHGGVDILAPIGSDVTAADGGVLEMREDPGGLGTYAVVWHPGGSATVYGHLSGYAEGLETGATVEPGQLIGYTGQTGNAPGTQPHVHFEIWTNFQTVGEGGTTGRRDPWPELTKENQ